MDFKTLFRFLISPFGNVMPREKSDAEAGQTKSRFVLLTLFTFYFLVRHSISGFHADSLVTFGLLGCYAVAAALIYVDARRRPSKHIARILIAIVIDDGIMVAGMVTSGEPGSVILGFLIWTVAANGYRYGLSFLLFSQMLAMGSFMIVYEYSPFWRAMDGILVPIISAILIIPYYMSDLLAKLKVAIRNAEAANLAKTQFVANISHEIRTPLHGILGLSEMIALRATDPEQLKFSQELSDTTSTLLNLVNDVLDYAKIEAGKLQIANAPFDLHDLVHRTTNLFALRGATKGIAVNSSLDEGVDRYVNGDSHHLQQVLVNLLGNAVKFTEKGFILVKVSTHSSCNDLVTIVFEVSDTGKGISPEFMPHVFDRFAQAETGTVKHQGTGLGTTIAKQVIEAMGGTIAVESTGGHGTTFRFELTFQKIADTAMLPKAGETLANMLGKAKQGEKLRVLVAEDNPTIRMIIENVLCEAGHPFVLVEDGREAAIALRRSSFDVVILDMQMPHSTGIDVCSAYKLEHPADLTIFILLSANVSQQTYEAALKAGFAHCLSKPLESIKLLQLLADINAKGAHSIFELSKAKTDVNSSDLLNHSILNDLARLQSQQNLFDHVVQCFETDSQGLINKIATSFAEGRFQDVKKNTHALTGCAQSIGAVALAHAASEMEILDTADLYDKGLKWLNGLVMIHSQSLQALREFASSHEPAVKSHEV